MNKNVLEVNNLKKIFYKNGEPFAAVDNISFSITKGECLGLVGESGCGKSTTANMIMQILAPTEGCICLDGKEVHAKNAREKKAFYADVQMVFQTPRESFDPRQKLGDGIMESLRNHGWSKADATKRMLELLALVELEPEMAGRFPHQVSGGQCQRAAIARALAIDPKLIICDEATSALDVTVQAQIVELLRRLQKELSLSILLICHDLALVQHLCDRVLVMYQGKIVEEGPPDEVIRHPKEAYTRQLIESVF